MQRSRRSSLFGNSYAMLISNVLPVLIFQFIYLLLSVETTNYATIIAS